MIIEFMVMLAMLQSLVELPERELFIKVIVVLWSTIISLVLFIAVLFHRITKEQKEFTKLVTEATVRSNIVIDNNTRTMEVLTKYFKPHIET